MSTNATKPACWARSSTTRSARRWSIPSTTAASTVAQEAVTLSSMPVWRHGRLQPRPFTLRIFLNKVAGRWQVMPGGFVRIADTADARAISLERGAATADAWLLARGPVGEITLLPEIG